jgi:hypothetical protein
MDSIDSLVLLSIETKDKFTRLRELSKDVFQRNTADECFDIARKLFLNSEYHPRALATYILGHIASKHSKSLDFLRSKVSLDIDWRVQEIFAQSFDCFCSTRGYEKSLSIISDWLSDANPNVRRAVTEGLRIWTGRPYFDQNPDVAIQMLSTLNADDSPYVRKSVGNALKDISKKYNELVKIEISNWNLSNSRIKETCKFASKHLNSK